MDQFATQLEALEHLWMRAWMKADRNEMKALASRDFMFLLGSQKPMLLDRASWLEAATTRLRCNGYRFGEVYVRKHGKTAVFACQTDLEARIGDIDWSGKVWISKVWQKGSVRRKWRLIEKTISRPDTDQDLPKAIREMQLWR